MDRLTGFPDLKSFDDVVDASCFRPLPDGWVVGTTDVVSSTEAIATGRYKAVNMAGAAAISGLMNALKTRRFPFVFGGDGCAFALPGEDRDVAATVLSETAAWVRDDLGLSLRVALVDVAAIRATGRDVRIALYAPSPHVSYAMIDGGGVAWAEAEMKAGRTDLPPAKPGVRPDLTGLSCRWQPIKAERGAMVSIIVRPAGEADGPFRKAVSRVLAMLGEAAHPVPERGPEPALVSPGARLEALASRGERPLWRRIGAILAHNLMGWGLFRTNMRAGDFDPALYRAVTSNNADAKKFGDGLMVTADCDAALLGRVSAFLEAEAAAGILRFGIVSQDAALMTCIVPSYQDHGHFHFIDGAGGGYAAAAQEMTTRDAARS
ncbi:DUF3095 domain-containing protein [Acuticoccus sp. MNP-M23]|uniref:DUF3095 domain-containing protein n=1 Tax=Acuticoccus sp. MNP-M23 TaxID=3072793 RepID=UPI002815E009|nr:DUF3095 domain-containing protein [Acuticoccus sp. MNP-M23]WMS41043.1 DUF3095 domain-containing protein [Acuticoccus sp. MNP-M23]